MLATPVRNAPQAAGSVGRKNASISLALAHHVCVVLPPKLRNRLGHLRPLALLVLGKPVDPVLLALAHPVVSGDRVNLLLCRPRPIRDRLRRVLRALGRITTRVLVPSNPRPEPCR